jgi:hypothetical protein
MPDSKMFQTNWLPEDIQRQWHTIGKTEEEQRKIRMFADLASLSKRFINAGVAFEELLTEQGLRNVSAAIYALEWRDLYYQAEAERRRRTERGYWHCLWDALRGR